jgi:ACR3 family arsenite transporter
MDMVMPTRMQAAPAVKRLNPFERYLTVWVGLCMVAGVLLGQAAPRLIQTLREMEFGQGALSMCRWRC